MDLDELLARSAPARTARTDALLKELDSLVLATEPPSRPRSKTVRAGVGTAVAGAFLGLGTVGAAAAGLVPTPTWVPWVTHSGSACEMEFSVVPTLVDGVQMNGEPLTAHYSAAEQDRALAEATAFLAAYDYESIDTDQAIADWKKREDAVIATQPSGEQQPRLRGEDLEITAVGSVVWRDLSAHMESEGIPAELVVSGAGWRCDK